jgi:alpha-ketoglutarate-dependent taurine dioxygenase
MASIDLVEDALSQDNDGVAFPAVLKPTDGVAPTAAQTFEWVKQHSDLLEALCAKHGAVLLRGVGLRTAQEFHDLLVATGWAFGQNPHVGGGGPRNRVIGPVHTSTESPPHFHIPFHHELAYIVNPPSKLFFFCQTPSADAPDKVGGETPLLNSSRLLRKIEAKLPAFVSELKAKGVRYVRVIQDRSNTGGDRYQKSWQEVFHAETREGAEQGARASGHDRIEWLDNGAVRVTSIVFAPVRRDNRNGVETWFNAVVLLHPGAHPEKVDAGKLWDVTFGDDSPIANADVAACKEIMNAEGMCFKYEVGDVLIVDNFIALHARHPFTPPRLILAAMVE